MNSLKRALCKAPIGASYVGGESKKTSPQLYKGHLAANVNFHIRLGLISLLRRRAGVSLFV